MPIVNSAVMITRVHMSLSILVSSVCMPSSGMAGSYGSSSASFVHARGEGERVLALESREGTRASRRVPAIPLLGIHTEETRIERDMWTRMIITALFTIGRTWKQQKVKGN